MKNKIVFVGGDKRQLFAALKLRSEGYDVYLSGFERISNLSVPLLDDFYEADIIVLPITGLKDGVIPCHYSDKEIKLDCERLQGKLVIMGKAHTLGKTGLKVYDILGHEDFAAANALPSAEGAVLVAMENFEGTIAGSKYVVIGYGRIGKVLSRMLKALNAEVTVTSRSVEKLAEISADGNTPIETRKLKSVSGYDIVFNTADAVVLDSEVLKNSENSALIIDLASLGGVDFDAAKALGYKAIHALGLPGKYSPKAAGEIISDTVLTILKEE